MGFWYSTIIIAGVIAIAYHFWERLLTEEIFVRSNWFWSWVCKGLAVPLFGWIIFNSGTSPWLRRVALNKAAGGPWILALVQEITPSVFVIASFWLGLTFSWWLFELISLRRENWGEYKGVILFWCFFLVPVALVIVLLSGWWGLGFAMFICAFPIAHSVLAMEPAKEMAPSYSLAIAKIKFGKYTEAETEVLEELERCQEDFDGWMMLADLYATRFDDFAEAEATIRDVCNQPTTNATQVSVALHRLAEWYLKLRKDPTGARRALGEICARFPGSHLARMAQLRSDQIPATREALVKQQHAKTIHLPAFSDDLEEGDANSQSRLGEEEASRLANQCVEKLKREPNDIAAREKLARLFAEQLDQADLGIEQMLLLLEIPDQPEGKQAEWLASIASWQLKYRDDPETAKIFLRRLISEYPRSAQAFAAQRKLNLLRDR